MRKVLHGITNGVDEIAKSDRPPHIMLERSPQDGNHLQCWLAVSEFGDCRMVRVARAAAEILIASGLSYGN